MIIEGKIQTTDLPGSEGQVGPVRLGKSFEMATHRAHGAYYDAVRRGNVFVGQSTAAGALTKNVTTSATGLILYNPLGSGKSLVMQEICIAIGSLPAGAAPLFIQGGAQTITPTTVTTGSILTPYQTQFANTKSVAAIYTAATIQATAATILRWIGGGPAATVATGTSFPPFIRDEIAGALIVGPGQVISLQCLTTAITVYATFTWEEVPVQ